jgi:hypothetical protein
MLDKGKEVRLSVYYISYLFMENIVDKIVQQSRGHCVGKHVKNVLKIF